MPAENPIPTDLSDFYREKHPFDNAIGLFSANRKNVYQDALLVDHGYVVIDNKLGVGVRGHKGTQLSIIWDAKETLTTINANGDVRKFTPQKIPHLLEPEKRYFSFSAAKDIFLGNDYHVFYDTVLTPDGIGILLHVEAINKMDLRRAEGDLYPGQVAKQMFEASRQRTLK